MGSAINKILHYYLILYFKYKRLLLLFFHLIICPLNLIIFLKVTENASDFFNK